MFLWYYMVDITIKYWHFVPCLIACAGKNSWIVLQTSERCAGMLERCKTWGIESPCGSAFCKQFTRQTFWVLPFGWVCKGAQSQWQKEPNCTALAWRRRGCRQGTLQQIACQSYRNQKRIRHLEQSLRRYPQHLWASQTMPTSQPPKLLQAQPLPTCPPWFWKVAKKQRQGNSNGWRSW